MKSIKFVSPDHIVLDKKETYISAVYLFDHPSVNFSTRKSIKYRNQRFFLKTNQMED